MILRSFLLALLLSSAPALAKYCGDDVGGADVPCACGDVVVSSVVLGEDPVATERCDGVGLVIEAASSEPIVIDLAGATLRGTGRGAGLLAMYGGSGGAAITSSGGVATLEGFSTGISSSAADGIGLLEKVVVRQAGRDGIRLRGKSWTVRGTEVIGAGRDSYVLTGHQFKAEGNVSRASGRHGFMLMGHSGTLAAHNRALQSSGFGFMVAGGGHVITDCEASGGMKTGMKLLAGDLEVGRCTVDGNLGDGIAGHGIRWKLTDNLASANAKAGIDVRGSILDLGGNRGVGNGGPVQCRISGKPCAE